MQSELVSLASELASLRPVMVKWLQQRTSSELTEEIVQQASLQALEKLDQLRDRRKLKAWFMQIIRNTLNDEFKRQERFLDLEQFPEIVADDSSLETQSCGCVLGMLQDIQPQYAQLLQAVDIHDQPVHKVAGRLGLNSNNTSVRLYRARKALRQRLKQVCGTQSARACLDCLCST